MTRRRKITSHLCGVPRCLALGGARFFVFRGRDPDRNVHRTIVEAGIPPGTL